MSVKPIPDGYHTVTPYLTVADAGKLLDFVKQAFDAQELHVQTGPDGAIRHAEIKIGDSMVMLGQAQGEWKPMPVMLYLYVEDADKLYQRAIQAGATVIQEIATQYYGDRSGGVQDCCGNQWWVATRVEDVALEELERRAAAATH